MDIFIFRFSDFYFSFFGFYITGLVIGGLGMLNLIGIFTYTALFVEKVPRGQLTPRGGYHAPPAPRR